MTLTQRQDPPEVLVRARHAEAVYVVGDASGRSFGCCAWKQGGEEVKVDFGV